MQFLDFSFPHSLSPLSVLCPWTLNMRIPRPLPLSPFLMRKIPFGWSTWRWHSSVTSGTSDRLVGGDQIGCVMDHYYNHSWPLLFWSSFSVVPNVLGFVMAVHNVHMYIPQSVVRPGPYYAKSLLKSLLFFQHSLLHTHRSATSDNHGHSSQCTATAMSHFDKGTRPKTEGSSANISLHHESSGLSYAMELTTWLIKEREKDGWRLFWHWRYSRSVEGRVDKERQQWNLEGKQSIPSFCLLLFIIDLLFSSLTRWPSKSYKA